MLPLATKSLELDAPLEDLDGGVTNTKGSPGSFSQEINNESQACLEQLENCLQSSLRENKALGEETRNLRSLLSASSIRCELVTRELENFRAEMTVLRNCDKKPYN